jgi:hypothetical protein
LPIQLCYGVLSIPLVLIHVAIRRRWSSALGCLGASIWFLAGLGITYISV